MSSDDLQSEPGSAVAVRTFRLILLMAQQMRTLMDQRLRPDGLTTQQAALLTVVETLGKPTLSQVASTLSTSHQNARQIADALQRKGFLTYQADPQDARIRRLHTTAANADFWAHRNDADHQTVGTWFDGLGPAETEALFSLLTRVEQRLKQALA